MNIISLKRHRMRRAISLAAVIAAVLTLGGVTNFVGECAGIRSQVLRLHVLAHSDEEADQALKLEVRDAILQESVGLLDGVSDKKEALETVRAALPHLTETAQACVREAGSDATVRAELCDMYFTTREYDNGTLPAGVYSALRVTIGEGKGHNWWCVVYPSMCLASAGKRSQWSDVLDPTQTDIVENAKKYEIRFKIVEWWEQLCRLLGW